jgi:hypothetical protein
MSMMTQHPLLQQAARSWEVWGLVVCVGGLPDGGCLLRQVCLRVKPQVKGR